MVIVSKDFNLDFAENGKYRGPTRASDLDYVFQKVQGDLKGTVHFKCNRGLPFDIEVSLTCFFSIAMLWKRFPFSCDSVSLAPTVSISFANFTWCAK